MEQLKRGALVDAGALLEEACRGGRDEGGERGDRRRANRKMGGRVREAEGNRGSCHRKFPEGAREERRCGQVCRKGSRRDKECFWRTRVEKKVTRLGKGG